MDCLHLDRVGQFQYGLGLNELVMARTCLLYVVVVFVVHMLGVRLLYCYKMINVNKYKLVIFGK